MENNIKILVVEDVPIAQAAAKMILEDCKSEVDIAENGREALKMFKENKYDIIFMDLGLPDISGIEVTKEIRNIEKKGSHTPIIALTANFDETYKPDFLEIGLDDFILKPLTKERAKVVINNFLLKSNLND